MTRSVDEQQERLDDGNQELLAGIRRIMGPSASDQARVRRGLSACLAAGALAPELPVSLLGARHGAGSGFASTGLQGLGKQLVAALVIGSAGFGAGLATGRLGSHADAGAQAHSAATSVAHEAPRTTPPAAIAESVSKPPDTPGDAPPAREAPKAKGSTANGPGVDARSLTDEADALRRVGQALREGQPQMAGEILDDLDARIPRGALGQERRAARLMVRCRTGDSSARAAARAWLARHARSVYAPRVRTSCGEPSPGGGDSKVNE
jgi:hypothetical protein